MSKTPAGLSRHLPFLFAAAIVMLADAIVITLLIYAHR